MKALVVLSGGMDSATALAAAVKLYGKEQVAAITFNYGSKHNERENECARKLATHYGISWRLVSLPLGDIFKSNLLQSGGEIPEGHYAEETMRQTVVPYRNAIMLSIAAGYAVSIGAKELFLGNHAGDHAVYPDCRNEFTKPFEQALLNGDWNPVSLSRPFENRSKGDVVKFGILTHVPYQLTHSCYKGGAVACGRCSTCVERLEAFDEAGSIDPIEYQDRTFYLEALAAYKSKKL